MNEYSGFQIGAFVAPLTAATTNPLLQDADPALYQAINFFQAMLALYLGSRFDAEVTKSGLPDLAGKVSSLAIPFDPVPQLQQEGLAPPFLAIFPVTETFAEHTRNWPHLVAHWRLLYVLPPLTPAQFLQLYPFLRAVAKVIFDRNEQGHDPGYASDALFCALGGIEQIAITDTHYGTIESLKTELYFPCLSMDLEVAERKMGAAAAQTAFAGIDTTLNVTDADGVSNPLTVAATSEALT